MVDKTLQQLIVDVETELHQSAGVSVQVYSQSNIAHLLKSAFELIIDEYDWKRFRSFATYTLNGTTGATTTAITFTDYGQIQRVYADTSDRALTLFTYERNPAAYEGDTALMYYHHDTDVIRVIPATSEGTITIVGSIYPASFDFALDETVPFDALALRYLAAWQYMVDDGTNAGSATKLQNLFETRLKQLKDMEMNAPISLTGGHPIIPNRWTER
jgi:hypothetical protein